MSRAARRSGASSTGRRTAEIDREIAQPLAAPGHLAQVQARRDLPDLVADLAGDERGLGVIQDDALLLVEPARRLVDLRPDRLHVEDADSIDQLPLLAVEHLPLPRPATGDPRQELFPE